MAGQKIKHLISRESVAFIVDRKARGRSKRTIEFYEDELRHFSEWLAAQSPTITTLEAITPVLIRQYMIDLATHRNAGGVHAAFRTVKAFLNWYQVELDDESYHNPIRKVTPPSPSKEPIPGISLADVRALIAACPPKTPLGLRDRAILHFLTDTGVRMEEFCKLNLRDIDFKSGSVQIIAGKGNKNRVVHLGAKSRRELIRYLRTRPHINPIDPLWLNEDGVRLKSSGLRQIIRRRALVAGVPMPGLHDFRRTFAIECLRAGMDLVTLMHLMGHTDTKTLQRYLKLIDSDLQTNHENASPGDKL